jgi:hypothetical protein
MYINMHAYMFIITSTSGCGKLVNPRCTMCMFTSIFLHVCMYVCMYIYMYMNVYVRMYECVCKSEGVRRRIELQGPIN